LSITKGRYNTAIGFQALPTDDVGDRSTAVGYAALYSQNSDSDNEVTGNTGLGFYAGLYNVTGQNNTYVGYNAGTGASGQSNSNNTAVGMHALVSITTGGYNTVLGGLAGNAINTGSNNVMLGYSAGTHGVDTSDGFKNVLIGSYSDTSATGSENQIAIGYDCSGQANNSVTLGNADVTAVYMSSDSQALVHSAGIQFAGTQVANAGANVLDDYEEGEHTPVLTDSQGDVTSIAMNASYNTLQYTKIGREVHVSGFIVVSSFSGSWESDGVFRMTLPFDCADLTDTYKSVGQAGVHAIDATAGHDYFWLITEGSANATLQTNVDNTSQGYGQPASTGQFAISITYIVA
jgi:hypothetical protein